MAQDKLPNCEQCMNARGEDKRPWDYTDRFFPKSSECRTCIKAKELGFKRSEDYIKYSNLVWEIDRTTGEHDKATAEAIKISIEARLVNLLHNIPGTFKALDEYYRTHS